MRENVTKKHGVGLETEANEMRCFCPPPPHSTENIGTTNTHEVLVEFKDFNPCDDDNTSEPETKDAKTGALVIWHPTQQEYADESDTHSVEVGFTERELAHKIYRFGNVATVFSSYEGKERSSGKVLIRGVNIYQVYYSGNRWWISSISWDGERDINSIPPELLPKK